MPLPTVSRGKLSIETPGFGNIAAKNVTRQAFPANSKQKPRFNSKSKSKTQAVGNSMSLSVAFQVNAVDRRKFVNLLLNGHTVRLQLDTASDISHLLDSLAVTWHPHNAADVSVRHNSLMHINFAAPLDGVTYLVVVDADSKSPEIAPPSYGASSANMAYRMLWRRIMARNLSH
ncbi:unnamed protein product [Dibothriocephalus latus]|uniref:Uncharacterized protein n=1 Tax=Dibothriocephalus latus TaxID=60516 RepID=A0A3P7PYQ9_DIBLA|nr:unnamed protein product [Dibothriocephalus latus]